MDQDIVTVENTVVACEGEGPAAGHPRVYLTFKSGSTELVCPYCSRKFKLSDTVKTTTH